MFVLKMLTNVGNWPHGRLSEKIIRDRGSGFIMTTLREIFKKTKQAASKSKNNILDFNLKNLFYIIILISSGIFVVWLDIALIGITIVQYNSSKIGLVLGIFFIYPIFLYLKWIIRRVKFYLKN